MTDKKRIQSAEVKKILSISEQQLFIYRKKGVITSVQYVPRGAHWYDKEAILKLRNGY